MAPVSPNHVLILVDAPTTPQGGLELPPDFSLLIDALKEAIAPQPSATEHSMQVTLASSRDLKSSPHDADLIIPLTFDIPEHLNFEGRSLYERCSDVDSLRQQVQEKLKIAGGSGAYWLPVVLTAKGPLYAEVIGQDEQEHYVQPIHLGDRWRQPLYRFAHQLLTYLQASPALYLVQFSFDDQNLVFDRVLPFPGLPAIASIKVQTPDLLTCHWRCLTHQPILDVAIAAPVDYKTYDPAIAP